MPHLTDSCECFPISPTARQLDALKPQPQQKFIVEKFLEWVQQQPKSSSPR
jgi:hypothetical protein